MTYRGPWNAAGWKHRNPVRERRMSTRVMHGGPTESPTTTLSLSEALDRTNEAIGPAIMEELDAMQRACDPSPPKPQIKRDSRPMATFVGYAAEYIPAGAMVSMDASGRIALANEPDTKMCPVRGCELPNDHREDCTSTVRCVPHGTRWNRHQEDAGCVACRVEKAQRQLQADMQPEHRMMFEGCVLAVGDQLRDQEWTGLRRGFKVAAITDSTVSLVMTHSVSSDPVRRDGSVPWDFGSLKNQLRRWGTAPLSPAYLDRIDDAIAADENRMRGETGKDESSKTHQELSQALYPPAYQKTEETSTGVTSDTLMFDGRRLVVGDRLRAVGPNVSKSHINTTWLVKRVYRTSAELDPEPGQHSWLRPWHTDRFEHFTRD
jgi:hypothetical protein